MKEELPVAAVLMVSTDFFVYLFIHYYFFFKYFSQQMIKGFEACED